MIINRWKTLILPLFISIFTIRSDDNNKFTPFNIESFPSFTEQLVNAGDSLYQTISNVLSVHDLPQPMQSDFYQQVQAPEVVNSLQSMNPMTNPQLFTAADPEQAMSNGCPPEQSRDAWQDMMSGRTSFQAMPVAGQQCLRAHVENYLGCCNGEHAALHDLLLKLKPQTTDEPTDEQTAWPTASPSISEPVPHVYDPMFDNFESLMDNLMCPDLLNYYWTSNGVFNDCNGPFVASFCGLVGFQIDVAKELLIENYAKICVMPKSMLAASVEEENEMICNVESCGATTSAIQLSKWNYGLTTITVDTVKPTDEPTMTPTKDPTMKPTMKPTDEPTMKPTMTPTGAPTMEPTDCPKCVCSDAPTMKPTDEPSESPTKEPTDCPPSPSCYMIEVLVGEIDPRNKYHCKMGECCFLAPIFMRFDCDGSVIKYLMGNDADSCLDTVTNQMEIPDVTDITPTPTFTGGIEYTGGDSFSFQKETDVGSALNWNGPGGQQPPCLGLPCAVEPVMQKTTYSCIPCLP